tara:strand:+ start:512 stop:652 length:141 start_codon:yes stop_codon:yes gene_type:complete
MEEEDVDDLTMKQLLGDEYHEALKLNKLYVYRIGERMAILTCPAMS